MNTIFKFLPTITFLTAFSLSQIKAQEAVPPPEPPAAVEESSEYNQSEFGAAATLSQSISTTTGIAMSPLAGMGALGAYQYIRSDADERANLPWYTNPWVWGTCFVIFLLLKSKDTLGLLIPEMVKKPITVVDDIQEKASALIVALAVIPPSVYNDVEQFFPQSATGAEGTAVAPLIIPIAAVILSVVLFAMVWLVFHAFSSIKIFSPSSFVNTGISIFRGLIIVGYALLACINSWVALAVAGIVILISFLIFGWAFRWNIFGLFFLKDFLTSAFNQNVEPDEKVMGFSTSNFPEVKPRTYGEIERDGDELVFSWKPGLIGLKRKKRVNISQVETCVRKGIFQPSVAVKTKDCDRPHSIFDMRMRFRTHEADIQERMALEGIAPNPVISGVLAAWHWTKDQLKQGASALSQAIESPTPNQT